jgi:hypothetical protein
MDGSMVQAEVRRAMDKSYDSVRRSVSVSRNTWFCDLCWQLRHSELGSLCRALTLLMACMWAES